MGLSSVVVYCNHNIHAPLHLQCIKNAVKVQFAVVATSTTEVSNLPLPCITLLLRMHYCTPGPQFGLHFTSAMHYSIAASSITEQLVQHNQVDYYPFSITKQWIIEKQLLQYFLPDRGYILPYMPPLVTIQLQSSIQVKSFKLLS